MSDIVKGKFKVDGMHCSSCAVNIDFDLEDLNGVKAAKTSYAKQETEVDFDKGKISPEEIVKAIQKTGYQAVFTE